MRYKTSFGNLLAEIEEYEWFFDVYVSGEGELNVDSSVFVINDEDEDERDENDEPAFPRSKGYYLLMSISQMIDVISNLREKTNADDNAAIVSAIKHYDENDSFPG